MPTNPYAPPGLPADLSGTLNGLSLGPEIANALTLAAQPVAPVDVNSFYNPVLEAIRGMQAPAPQQVPGVASPLGTFLSLFAANLGSSLAKRPELAAPTNQLLEEQRANQLAAQQTNVAQQNAFKQQQQGLTLDVLVKQAENGLQQAIANGDDAAAKKAAALLKAADYLQERATIKLQGEKSMGIQQEIGKQQRELVKTKSAVRQAVEDMVDASGLSKQGAALVMRQIAGYVGIAESMTKPDPDTGQIAPGAESRAADFLDQRVQSAIDAQLQREGGKTQTTNEGGGMTNILGVSVDKNALIKRAREIGGSK